MADDLEELAKALGIEDDDESITVPDDQLISVGELEDPPDESEVD